MSAITDLISKINTSIGNINSETGNGNAKLSPLSASPTGSNPENTNPNSGSQPTGSGSGTGTGSGAGGNGSGNGNGNGGSGAGSGSGSGAGSGADLGNGSGSGSGSTQTPTDTPHTNYTIDPTTGAIHSSNPNEESIINGPKDPTTEGAAYNELAQQAQAEINAIEQKYAGISAQENSATNAELLASGMAGSGTAASKMTSEQTAVTAQENSDIAAVYDNIMKNAQSLAQMGQTENANAVNLQQNIQKNVLSSVDSLAAMGTTASELYSESPDLYKSIIAATGMSDFQLQNYMISKLPPSLQPIVTDHYTPDPNNPNKTILEQTITYPTTGQQETQSWTINAPYNIANPNAFKQGGDGNLYEVQPDGSLKLVTPQKPVGIPYTNAVLTYNDQTNSYEYADLSSTDSSGNSNSPIVQEFQSVINGYTPDVSIIQQLNAAGITPQALLGLAQTFILNGMKLPSGLGISGGGAVKGAIQAAGYALATQLGISAAKGASIGANVSAQTKALGTATTQFAMINGYEMTTLNNMSILDGVISNLGGLDTNVPLFNKALQNIVNNVAANTNNAALTQLQAAIYQVVSEYAKVMGGGTGSAAPTVSTQEEARKILNSAQTPTQIEATLSLMKSEMAGRVKALQDNMQQIQDAISSALPSGSSSTNNSGSNNNSGTTTSTSSPASSNPNNWKQVNGKWVQTSNG